MQNHLLNTVHLILIKLNVCFREITQSQNQLVVYRGNHFYYSPYVTETQTTTIELSSSTVESYSKLLNPDKEGSQIKYGDSKEFENVSPFTQVF